MSNLISVELKQRIENFLKAHDLPVATAIKFIDEHNDIPPINWKEPDHKQFCDLLIAPLQYLGANEIAIRSERSLLEDLMELTEQYGIDTDSLMEESSHPGLNFRLNLALEKASFPLNNSKLLFGVLPLNYGNEALMLIEDKNLREEKDEELGNIEDKVTEAITWCKDAPKLTLELAFTLIERHLAYIQGLQEITVEFDTDKTQPYLLMKLQQHYRRVVNIRYLLREKASSFNSYNEKLILPTFEQT